MDGLRHSAPDLPKRSAWHRSVQRRLLAEDLPSCWIAVAPDGTPCYMQWLITAKDNARIRERWDDLFPPLGADEALVEGVFTAAYLERRETRFLFRRRVRFSAA